MKDKLSAGESRLGQERDIAERRERVGRRHGRRKDRAWDLEELRSLCSLRVHTTHSHTHTRSHADAQWCRSGSQDPREGYPCDQPAMGLPSPPDAGAQWDGCISLPTRLCSSRFPSSRMHLKKLLFIIIITTATTTTSSFFRGKGKAGGPTTQST